MRKAFKILSGIITGIIGLLLALLLLATAIAYRPDKIENAVMSGKTPGPVRDDSVFSVISWNIGYFGLGTESDFFYDGGKMTRPGEDYYRHCAGNALDYLYHSEKADFYFFQEVDTDARRSYFDDQVGLLGLMLPDHRAAFAMNYRVHFVPVPLKNPMGKVKSGIVTMLNAETTENTRFAFPGGYSWPVSLFMLKRCYLLSRITLPSGKDLVLIHTHNEPFDDGRHRRQQMTVLQDVMTKEYERGNYVVAGGDWNINPYGFTCGDFTNGDKGKEIPFGVDPDFFPDGWQWVFDPAVPTNRDVDQPYTRGVTPTTIIDFFIVSPNVEVLEVKTTDLAFEWADHQPMKLTVQLQ
jgi:endonuclease/exonuclease/phosphatase family metal-dependent hydrolase